MAPRPWQVLVVEDSVRYLEDFRREVVPPLQEAGTARFAFAGDLASARTALQKSPPDYLMLDIVLPLEPGGEPNRGAGVSLLRELPQLAPDLPVTVLSGQDRQDAVQLLLSRRVDGYLFKDQTFGEVRIHLERALELLRLRQAERLHRAGLGTGPGDGPRTLVHGGSTAFGQVLEKARRVARTDTTVLLQGESGTGKEILARFLHAHSSRAEGPFVAVSCGALPEGLAEAELFGARKGAYTGLDHDREGALALARGGTLFLDEIGELPTALQPKLLRALQERTFRPLGAEKEEEANLRLVCATHRDLEEMARKGEFRQDLLFRVRVFPVDLPPLRERREDLPALLLHMVERFNREMGRRVRGFTDEALLRLRSHSWPGNIRELLNAVEYAFVLGTGDELGPECLPRLADLGGPASAPPTAQRHREAMESFEKGFLERSLKENGWHLGRTATAVDLPRRTLQSHLARLGIRVRDETG